MKNLSLQMTDTATLKKPADVVNKSNTSTDSAASAENKASFQMMFNKQVQAKHASSQDAQSNQAQNNVAKKTTAKESESVTTKSESIDESMAQQNAQKASHLQLVMTATKHTKTIKNAETTDATPAATKDSTELDAKSKPLKRSDEDSKSEDAVTTVADVNFTSVSISSAILPSAILENKLVAPSISNPNTELAAANETLSEKQRSLSAEIRDTVLNNALSQGKNSDPSVAQSIEAGDDKRSQNNWVDAILPNASAKQMNNDDAANLMLNAAKEGAVKEHAIKEPAIKEVAMPANFQSTTQINATEAMKQVGGSNTINAYPGKTGWDQAISQKVVWMLGAQEQSATLTLNPPEMGPLQVVIHVHNDQADTTFISDNAEVRQALQDGMDNLRNKLNESGIQLGQANVNSGGQMQQQFQQSSQQKGLGSQQIADASVAPIEIRNGSQRIAHLANGLVDTFA
jgi:flagellar hook-length control protein FliK